MSLDLNSLVAKPQTNLAVSQPSIDKSQPLATAAVKESTAPVVKQPLATDTFQTETSKEESKTGKMTDQILKYSGVAALILTPILVFASHKMNSNNFTKSLGEVVKKVDEGKVFPEIVNKQINEIVNKSLDDIGKKASGENISSENLTNQVTDVVTKSLEDVTKKIDEVKVSQEKINNTVSEHIENIRTVIASENGIDIYSNEALNAVKIK